MRKMKQETPEQRLKKLCKEIIFEREVWKHINEEGCNDPFWPDGTNMNLTRNHILSYRNEIAEICGECGFNLPEEYFLKVPPVVPDNYVAVTPRRKGRIEKLRQGDDEGLKYKRNKFNDDGQMEFC